MTKFGMMTGRGLLLLAFFLSFAPAVKAQPTEVWGTRPLLSYFALTASLETRLYQGARLSSEEFSLVQNIAWQEAESLRALIEFHPIDRLQPNPFTDREAALDCSDGI